MAFRANTGKLWTVGQAGTKEWPYSVAAGTNPSIAMTGNGFQVAFNAAGTNRLWTVGNYGDKGWTTVVMAPNTSPSMASFQIGLGVLVQASSGQALRDRVVSKQGLQQRLRHVDEHKPGVKLT